MSDLRVTVSLGAKVLFTGTFTTSPVTLGRGEGRDIILDYDFVSRLHCSFVREQEQWILVDSSASGVLMGGKRAARFALAQDQSFTIEGHSVLKLRVELV